MPAAPEKPVHCYSTMQATDASEIVHIVRDLTRDDNSHGASDHWDPMLTVRFAFAPSELHPDDNAPVSDGIENIRASDLYRLAEILPSVIETARFTGVLPHPLTEEEYTQRFKEAFTERERRRAEEG
jgi:hypothetical protein